MSTCIKPCRGCPLRNGCSQKEIFKKKISGLGLRSATFNCSILADAIKPGTRIVVMMPIVVPSDHGDYEVSIGKQEVSATIHSRHGDEFSCIVDRECMVEMEENGYMSDGIDIDRVRFRKSMKHSRIIRFLDEPVRSICRYGNPILPSGKCDSRDGKCTCKQHQFETCDVGQSVPSGAITL